MTLQNRCMPDGSIVAQPWRGTLMGNRGGKIHDPQTRSLAKRRWASRRWIICVTKFKNRHREVMGEGYTELFFADEASALTAGHRPCFECQRARANTFAECWSLVFGAFSDSRADAMDKVLHHERLALRPVVTPQQIETLPDGVMLKEGNTFFVLRDSILLEWSPQGYRPAAQPADILQLLTPPSVVEVLRAGYQPQLSNAKLHSPGGR